jgi:hypothetical protein
MLNQVTFFCAFSDFFFSAPLLRRFTTAAVEVFAAAPVDARFGSGAASSSSESEPSSESRPRRFTLELGGVGLRRFRPGVFLPAFLRSSFFRRSRSFLRCSYKK